jgi:hypothetical protein
MARIAFKVEFELAHEIAASSVRSTFVEHLLNWPEGSGPGGNFSVTPCEPDHVDAHGEHRGTFDKPLKPVYTAEPNLSTGSMAIIGLAPMGEPEKPTLDCSCGMGLGAQPNAHIPQCPSYRGSVNSDPVVYHGNPKVEPVEVLANQSTGADGAKEDVSKEYDQRTKDIDTMLSSISSDPRFDRCLESVAITCYRCGFNNGAIETDSATPFYSPCLPCGYGRKPLRVDLCGDCYDLVVQRRANLVPA